MTENNQAQIEEYEKNEIAKLRGEYSNKFYFVHGSDGMIRLIFADQMEKSLKPNINYCVVLSGQGFMTLLNSLNANYEKMIQRTQPQQENLPNKAEPVADREKLN